MLAPRHPHRPLIAAALLLAAAGFAADTVPLKDGGSAAVVRLEADGVSVAMIPELGGKLISIKGPDGYEWLSRSPRPYRARAGLKAFGDGEFDGADEIFPSMGECDGIPPHGELWRLAWTKADGPGLTYVAEGKVRPYRFQRSITIEHGAIEMAYRMENRSDADMPYYYLLHPLFSIAEPLKLELPPEQMMRVNFSQHDFLGKGGTELPWSDLTASFFAKATASVTELRYWGLVTDQPPQPVKLRRPGGAALALSWDDSVMPRMAIWCTEASPNVDNLAHLALEPCTSAQSKLSDAIKEGVARTLPAGVAQEWKIRFAFEAKR